jgi:polyketide biosynthesis enoyl-CoA hydratase PksI
MSLVTLERDGDGIATIALVDSEHKNAFREPFIDELCARLDELQADEQARVCLLRGLPEVFCAGADESLLLELAAGTMAATDIVLPKLVLDLPIPVIAAMEGHAIGGGLALGLCCDVVLMARESRYGCSFMNMGFTPGMGTTRLLDVAVGEYLAAEMMYGGQLFKGSHFADRAGVNYVLPRAELWPRALEVARRIAEKPRFALSLLKRTLSLRRRQAFEESRGVESMMHELCFARPETAEQIRESYPRVLDPKRTPSGSRPPTGRKR